jgi:glutamate N-acetyltransferase / amino-acid N-acetyltransferase
MECYGSSSEYLKALEDRSALPEGFCCSTASIRFTPGERPVAEPLPMNLALILMDSETEDFAGVFTRNRFPGAPVLIGRERLNARAVRGVLVNNKVSNVCAPGGKADAESLLATLGRELGISGDMLFPSSTGIIGWKLPVADMARALPGLAAGLSRGSILPAARAIMTTDSYPKVRRAAVGSGSIVGIAKGAGMMEPNMATLLCFLLTDVAVPRERLREELAWCVDRTLNRISVDGDQSTSDTTLAFSSGRRGPADPEELRAGLLEVLSGLAADIVRNGEGAGHVMRVRVSGAADEKTAAQIGKAVVNSPLVKTAVCGNDPNVGRIISAVGDYLGNAGAPEAVEGMSVHMGGTEIFSRGEFRLDAGAEAALSAYLSQAGFPPETRGYPPHDRCVEIEIRLTGPCGPVEVLGTDLTCGYVRENADYRS